MLRAVTSMRRPRRAFEKLSQRPLELLEAGPRGSPLGRRASGTASLWRWRASDRPGPPRSRACHRAARSSESKDEEQWGEDGRETQRSHRFSTSITRFEALIDATGLLLQGGARGQQLRRRTESQIQRQRGLRQAVQRSPLGRPAAGATGAEIRLLRAHGASGCGWLEPRAAPSSRRAAVLELLP